MLPFTTYEELIHLKEARRNWHDSIDEEELPLELEYPDYPQSEKHWVDNIDSIPNGKKCIVFSDCDNKYFWNDLIKLPKSVEYIYLGHDGVISFLGVTIEEINHVIEQILKALPNLFWIEYCGYYSCISVVDIESVALSCDRRIFCEAIY